MFLNLFHSLHVVGSANDRDAIVDKESRAICRKRSDRALLSFFPLSFFLSLSSESTLASSGMGIFARIRVRVL